MAELRTLIYIRPARMAEHQELCRIARTSKHTSSFSHRFFSAGEAYEKGWIRVAEVDGKVVGYTCVRHRKVRPLETVLHFVTVLPEFRSRGVGEALMLDLFDQTPHGVVALNVNKQNTRAIAFYERLGFRPDGKALGGSAFRMRWQKGKRS